MEAEFELDKFTCILVANTAKSIVTVRFTLQTCDSRCNISMDVDAV